jgi:hypothetical protein
MKIIGIEDMGNLELRTEIQKGGKFIMYQYVISILIMTFKRNSNIYFVKVDESAVVKGLPYSLLSFLFGWWGIPWGIIYTIQALITNFGGGKDVTAQVLASGGQAASPQNINPT